MVEPVTVSIIIGIIASSLISLMLMVTFIKHGVDITDKIADIFRNIRYDIYVIHEGTDIKSFIAMCSVFTDHTKIIKCDKQTINIPDTSGKEKRFFVPVGGKYIELKLDDDTTILVQTLSACRFSPVNGFVIYYKTPTDFIKFAEKAFKNQKFMTEEQYNEIVGHIVPTRIIDSNSSKTTQSCIKEDQYHIVSNEFIPTDLSIKPNISDNNFPTIRGDLKQE